MTEVLQDLEGANVIVGAIIVWGENMQRHNNRLRKVLQKVIVYIVKLSPEWFQLGKEKIYYVISKDSLKADPEKVSVIKEITSE